MKYLLLFLVSGEFLFVILGVRVLWDAKTDFEISVSIAWIMAAIFTLLLVVFSDDFKKYVL